MKKLLLIVLLMPTMAIAQKDLLINYDTVMVPVELIYFRGTEKGGMVYLEWSTATELNNDHFFIEYSNDGENFYPLKVVMGRGTTTKKQDYKAIIDYQKYFRLYQVDFSNTIELLKVIMVKRNDPVNYNYSFFDINGRSVHESYRGLKIKAKM